jgi:predicted thioesterase
MVTTTKTEVGATWWSKLAFLRKVLITGWMVAIVMEAIALVLFSAHVPNAATLFILGWVVSCMAGIGTIAARVNHKI